MNKHKIFICQGQIIPWPKAYCWNLRNIRANRCELQYDGGIKKKNSTILTSRIGGTSGGEEEIYQALTIIRDSLVMRVTKV